MRIVKSALMVPVRDTMGTDFFRDCRRVLAQISCNVFKRDLFIQTFLDIKAVFKG